MSSRKLFQDNRTSGENVKAWNQDHGYGKHRSNLIYRNQCYSFDLYKCWTRICYISMKPNTKSGDKGGRQNRTLRSEFPIFFSGFGSPHFGRFPSSYHRGIQVQVEQ